MIVFLTNIPTPYRVPLFNLIAGKLAEKRNPFHVLFAMPTYGKRLPWADVLREAKFDYSVMDFPKVSLGYDAVVFLPYNISSKIDRLNPSCLVISGFNLMAMLASRYARRRKIPYIIWSGGTKAEFDGFSARRVREYLRRGMVRHAAGFIAYGTEASRHLQFLGADPEKISVGINSVDTDFFQKRVASLKGERAADDGSMTRILYVGHLQRRKGLDLVLRALAQIRHDDIILDVVGDGPERAEYEALARQLGLDCVNFLGYRKKEDLPEFYAAADIFVFPSVEEVFGLVLVEAAAAGLPLVASKLAGGTADLVREGRNGYVVDPRDIDEMGERLRRLCDSRELRKSMGEESHRIITESVNIHRSADGFVEAIMRATHKPLKPADAERAEALGIE
jgi:glycosyltransferase involved in cell wall biosynthesis